MWEWLEEVKRSLIAKYLGSVVRHAITALCGAIGTLGIIDAKVLEA